MVFMDFLNPQKKRAHLMRLYVGYGLTAVLLAIGTLILTLASYGYGIDRNTGTVIQNGLISVASHPQSARIFVNNEDKGSTSSRLVLPAGQYNLELRSDGYRSWEHKVNLEGSIIEQLIYPVLFPEKLSTKSIQDFVNPPQMASQSPDRRWLLTYSQPSTNIFNLIDLGNAKHPITSLTLPSDTVSMVAGVHSYEAIEWSSDNVHLLLRHTFTGGVEYIMLNREDPANSVNINKLFPNQPFTSISLRDKKADQFYLLSTTGGLLFRADNKSPNPVLLLSGVLSYKSYGSDTIMYVIPSKKITGKVEARVSRGDKDNLLRNLPIAPLYLLDMAQFDNAYYLTTGSSADGRTYIYKDPLKVFEQQPTRSPQPFRVMIVPGLQFSSFSANTRFVVVQGGSSFGVYDIETARQFRYDTKLALNSAQKANWMDGHRLTLISAGNVNVFDFDNTNLQVLTAGLQGFGPYFDRDYAAMFTITSSTNKTSLTRTELIVSK